MGKVRVMARYNKPPRKYTGIIVSLMGWALVGYVYFLCFVEITK
jgi:hypothetical protein